MPESNKPHKVAILFSDLHLTLQRPACRADEDWMEVQRTYLCQLIAHAWAGSRQLPIFFAGDLFDKWNPPAELIKWAIDHLPDGMFCVPGQHDLPNHRLDQMHKSGYGVLEAAGKIVDITGRSVSVDSINAHGFGWGMDITGENVCEDDDTINLAVVHKYVWSNKSTAYPGAKEESRLGAFGPAIRPFDAVVFGDNHKGFLCKRKGQSVINTGGFIRRKSDEVDYRPRIGLLMDDGSIVEKFLHTEGVDVFEEKAKERPEIAVNMAEFIRDLEELGEHGLNFQEAVEDRLRADDIEKETREIILGALEA